MLIGPQNLAVHVNHVRSRIRTSALAAGRDPASVTLVAVSKSQSAAAMRSAAAAGVTDFGENYLQEALPKMDALADLKLHWHFIGASIGSTASTGPCWRGACPSSVPSTRRR